MLCTIKKPNQPQVTGTILEDLGSEFSIQIDQKEPIPVPKLYVFPGISEELDPRLSNSLSILDAAQSRLKAQITKFKGNPKKANTCARCQEQLQNLSALRVVVEGGQPLAGMWVSKTIENFKLVGQISEVGHGEQSTWVTWWGSPTPYPEDLGNLAFDAFAQITTLKPGSQIRICGGHFALKPGTLFQVQDLHANGWILTSDEQLISSNYWEVASEEPQPTDTDTIAVDIPAPTQDPPRVEDGSPVEPSLPEGVFGDSDFQGESHIQLQDEEVQPDLAYRQLIQMGIPPAQARYLVNQGIG